jgi:hypothetical protein
MIPKLVSGMELWSSRAREGTLDKRNVAPFTIRSNVPISTFGLGGAVW